jgi:hypothetical protein
LGCRETVMNLQVGRIEYYQVDGANSHHDGHVLQGQVFRGDRGGLRDRFNLITGGTSSNTLK